MHVLGLFVQRWPLALSHPDIQRNIGVGIWALFDGQITGIADRLFLLL